MRLADTTNVRATLYFHQFCGRMTRVQSSDLERAFVFMPADPELEVTARQIEEEVAHALGEEVPIREPTARGGRRRSGFGITVEDSDGSLNNSIFGGRSIPSQFMRQHEATIREFRENHLSVRNMPTIELVLLMIDVGKLPGLVSEKISS